MRLNLLCIGDVVGSPGRMALKETLSCAVRDHDAHGVIVNAENVSGGSGLTTALYEKLISYGVDVVTLGDHLYRRREIISTLETSDRLIKPANLPVTAPGKDVAIYTLGCGVRIAVVSLLGRLFMKLQTDCPFAAIDRVLRALPDDVKTVVVDMHAEATSEKVAMGWHLDGRVSVLFGTHTHVPTADERVLPKGTAYITDVGMTGPYDSVLGRDTSSVLSFMARGIPTSFGVAAGDVRMCGICVTVDSTTGKAEGVERICYRMQGAAKSDDF